MRDDNRAAAAPRSSSSYLVRIWLEPRESEASPQLRCYVRDLETGEELYTADPGLLTDQLLSRVRKESAAIEAAEADQARQGG